MHLSPKINHKPEWLKNHFPSGEKYLEVKKIVKENGLHTICSSGICPNISECWGAGTATFMILGNTCTRSCKFCNVASGKPEPIDLSEPTRVAESVRLMKLDHCVVTSVSRDDLPEDAANLWAQTISEIKKLNPGTTIETLIPDFLGKTNLIKKIIDSKPTVISHNIETVRRLTPLVRSRAKYDLSLSVLKFISDNGCITKSGIMVGLGESENEIYESMDDLLKAGCSIFTIGQYLQPTKGHIAVIEYITPEIFEKYKKKGIEKGFRYVESGPLVRSSFHAEKQLLTDN